MYCALIIYTHTYIGNLPNPGIQPGCPASQADSLLSEPPGKISNISVCVYNQSTVHCLNFK